MRGNSHIYHLAIDHLVTRIGRALSFLCSALAVSGVLDILRASPALGRNRLPNPLVGSVGSVDARAHAGRGLFVVIIFFSIGIILILSVITSSGSSCSFQSLAACFDGLLLASIDLAIVDDALRISVSPLES